MPLAPKAQNILDQISEDTKLGDLRKIAAGIKKDHALAIELWSTGKFMPRMLSILIMDKKELNSNVVDQLIEEIERHPYEDRLQLADWLMANQLTKEKKTVTMMESWQNSSPAIKRRLFWYYQGRLRWMGQIPRDNAKQLLAAIEGSIANESPEVQWAMNFTAGWIGIFDQSYRDHCIKMGEKFGLYKDEMVARNCTPNYLPKFIEIESAKRNL